MRSKHTKNDEIRATRNMFSKLRVSDFWKVWARSWAQLQHRCFLVISSDQSLAAAALPIREHTPSRRGAMLLTSDSWSGGKLSCGACLIVFTELQDSLSSAGSSQQSARWRLLMCGVSRSSLLSLMGAAAAYASFIPCVNVKGGSDEWSLLTLKVCGRESASISMELQYRLSSQRC